MYTYIYMYIYIYIHIYVCIHICVFVCVRVFAYLLALALALALASPRIESISGHCFGRTPSLRSASTGRVEVGRVCHNTVFDVVSCDMQTEF